MTLKDLLSLEETAQVLHKSVQTVRRMIKRGNLAVERIRTPQGFQYAIPRTELPLEKFEPNLERLELREELLTPLPHPTPPPFSFSQLIPPLDRVEPQRYLANDHYSLELDSKKTAAAAPPSFPYADWMALLHHQHKEKMMLIHILEKLQDELRQERQQKEEKHKSLLARLLGWF